MVDALRDAAGTRGRCVAHARRPATVARAQLVAPALGVTVLALAGGIAIVTRHHDPAPAIAAPASSEPPPPGTLALAITTDARRRAGRRRRSRARPGAGHAARRARRATSSSRVAKPGYVADHRTLDAGQADSAIAITLGAVTGFEGVWRLPDGELRAFERRGDQRRRLQARRRGRTAQVLPPLCVRRRGRRGVAFAADDEVVDPRAPDDPTCHQPVHVEYRYDAQRDVLELDRPTVDVDFVGRAVRRTRSQRIRDRGSSCASTRITRLRRTHLAAPASGLEKISARKPPRSPRKPSKRSRRRAKPTAPPTNANRLPAKVNGQLLPPPQTGYPVRQPAPSRTGPRRSAANADTSRSGDVAASWRHRSSTATMKSWLGRTKLARARPSSRCRAVSRRAACCARRGRGRDAGTGARGVPRADQDVSSGALRPDVARGPAPVERGVPRDQGRARDAAQAPRRAESRAGDRIRIVSAERVATAGAHDPAHAADRAPDDAAVRRASRRRSPAPAAHLRSPIPDASRSRWRRSHRCRSRASTSASSCSVRSS